VKKQSPQHSHMENALRGLGLIIKAVRFYPENHPARIDAIERGISTLRLALDDLDHVALKVRREQLSIEPGPKLRGSNPAIQALAYHLFARRIFQLMILADISARDLERAACALALEPEEIIRRGGIAKVFSSAGIETLWVNETDLNKILGRREMLREMKSDTRSEAEQKEPLADRNQSDDGAFQERDQGQPPLMENSSLADQRRTLEEILSDLAEKSSEARFRRLVNELTEVIYAKVSSPLSTGLLAGLSFLALGIEEKDYGESERTLCRKNFETLMTSERIDQLIDFLCGSGRDDSSLNKVHFLLRKSGEQGARQLGERLAEEKEAKRRKILAQALTAFGRSALATLDRLLRDERWYVVRNAATILGEIRDPETAGRLAALLGHKDERVRREAIRALTRLGTTEAMDVLLVAVEEGDPDLQRQALLSLGAMKQTKAIPYLLRFLERSDPFVRCLELKRGAVRALGDMGAAEAVPALRALLQQRKFFFRRRFQEIQIACCLALARIGTDECRRVLEITTQHGHGPLSRSAARALREIARAEKS